MFFEKICKAYNLGDIISIPCKLQGGLTNTVWKLGTESGEYIVKSIDVNSLRARAIQNYNNIEIFKYYLKNNSVNLSLALKHQNDYYMTIDKDIVIFVYPYIKGKILYQPTQLVSYNHAKQAGIMLAKIHSANITDNSINTNYTYDYGVTTEELEVLFARAKAHNLPWSSKTDLININKITGKAYSESKYHQLYSHGDFMPHNIVWQDDLPYLLDWELAGLINPDLELMLALICFSGFAQSYQLNKKIIKCFLYNYREILINKNNILNNIESCIYAALHKGWVNWIVYNMKRSFEDNRLNDDVVNLSLNLELLYSKADIFYKYIKTVV